MRRIPKRICALSFKRWSRKNYGVLLSLHLVIRISVICFSYCLVNPPKLNAQIDTVNFPRTQYEFDGVEITGRRSQTVTSSISRVVSVIRREEIEKQGSVNFTDFLEFISNVDIRQRGIMGVQSDVSLRGGSFDHVMILLNGVNMSDPQTGHLAADLPVESEAIERIEVLEGPAARSLGAGAFNGAINIITKNGSVPELSVRQVIGDFNLYRTGLNAGIKSGRIFHFISAGRSSSSGYSANTDHEIYNVYYRLNGGNNQMHVDFQSGFQTKDFGAAGFYSPRFPNQYEENSGLFGSLRLSYGKPVRFSHQLYWKRRYDHFVLIRDDPGSPENFHMTDVYGSQFNVTIPVGEFTWNGGIDLRSENILSNNIGMEILEPIKIRGTDSSFYTRQYQRTNFSFFAEQVYTPGNWDLTAGFMIMKNTGFHPGLSVFPGIEIGYTYEGHTAFANFNRTLHLPTFTDLFYKDPVNQGNMDLDPNRLISLEAGLKKTGNTWSYHLSGFYNIGKDIVDWLWNQEVNRFSPVNLESYVSSGISSSLSVGLSEAGSLIRIPARLTVYYMYIKEDKSSVMSVSKYYSLKHKLSASLNVNVAKPAMLIWRISFQDRHGNAIAYNETEGFKSVPYKPFWLLDGIIKVKLRYFELYSEVTNLFNTRYIDAGSAYQPGRWFRIGVNFKADFKNQRGIH